MQPGRIQLTEDDGSPLVIPAEVTAFRRFLLACQILGRPGSTKARWCNLIVLAANERWRRFHCMWSRAIVDRYNAIVADPEAHGADSEDEML